MSKNQSAAVAQTRTHSLKNVRTLVVSAVLAAISVVLARLIIPMPDVSTRFSLEAVPIFLAGMFFGPIPGALVGFSAMGTIPCSASRRSSMACRQASSARC